MFLLSIHSDAVVSQVLDELGLTLTDELSSKYLHEIKIRKEVQQGKRHLIHFVIHRHQPIWIEWLNK